MVSCAEVCEESIAYIVVLLRLLSVLLVYLFCLFVYSVVRFEIHCGL